MPVNQPAINPDPTVSSWELEVTIVLNQLEQSHLALLRTVDALTQRVNALEEREIILEGRVNSLLQEIQAASDLMDLQTRTRGL